MNTLEISASFPALGTTARILVTDHAALDEASEEVRAEVAAIDAACSRFRPDSELSALNDGAGGPVQVSALFLDALDVALRAARATGGKVTPTVGSAMRLLGYDRDFSEVNKKGGALQLEAVSLPGWRAARVDRATSSVQVPEGVELDLGATAKAFCSDRAARAAVARAGGGVLVSLGGDIAVAGATPGGGWPVRVTHNHADPIDAPGQTVTVPAGGLATSSTTVRRWERDGRTLHHLVDPSTGRSARGCWQTVSVAAGSCVDANIASTAAIIMGSDALRWLELQGLPARLVDNAGAVTVVAGWPLPDGADRPWS